MRNVLVIFFLAIGINCFAQIHIECISEKTDSMALINKHDIGVINKVFEERKMLDSLNTINEKLIEVLELNNKVQSSVIEDQIRIIKNKDLVIDELETRNENSVK